MNDDMPWVDLTPEEIQELRTNKQELTEYGKQKIRELMNDGKLKFYDKGKETFTIDGSCWGKVQTPEIKLEVKEMNHEEMLEVAAEREKENEVLKIAIDFIEEHSEAMKQLRKIEHEELIEELQAKKKENFQLVADACMKEYEKTYNRDVFPMSEYWVYMVAEYFGTGEGQTTCIMMTQANPGHPEDFETSTNKYVPCTTKEYRAVREFHEQFGTWMLHGLKFLTKEDFFGDFAFCIPPMMIKLSNEPCYKTFYTRVHYNFS